MADIKTKTPEEDSGPITNTAEEAPPEEESEEEESEEEESGEEVSAPHIGNFFSPDAVLMLALAAILDIIGYILIYFGLDDFWITDAIGVISIGGWMFFRTGHVTITKKGKKMIQKTGRKIAKRLGLSFLVEIIPWLGDVSPSWFLAVYFEIKNN